MSCFTSPAIMEMLGHYKWRVYEPFRFYLSEDKNDVIEVPVGFVTDLATVPRIFWSLLPPDVNMPKRQSFMTTCIIIHYVTEKSPISYSWMG